MLNVLLHIHFIYKSKDQKTSTPNQDGQASELYTPQKMSAIPKKTDNAPARTKSNLKPKGMLSLCVFNLHNN